MKLEDIALHDLAFQLRVVTRAGDLKQSLEEKGQLEPVHLLGPPPYRIIDGFRRCTAVTALGWKEVSAFLHDGLGVAEAIKMAFTLNTVRMSYSSVDKANGIRMAMKLEMTKLDVAEQFGLSERHVGRYLSLLRLPVDVQAAIDDREFTMAHALVLAEFDVGNVEQIVAEVKAKKLTAAQLRKRLRSAAGKKKPGKGRPTQLVARDGDYLRFHGEFCLAAPQEERERLAEQLIYLVALLQRPSSGRRNGARSRAADTEETGDGQEEVVA